ncbi:Uncharacterised protein [Mycobacteroides abscessus subsp. abscessus]|nr:Uncharacterised protein [Mycobacteroides abscessus subsp. abscessus]
MIGPYPMPIRMAPIAAHGRLPTHISAMPAELINSDAWLQRIAPKRLTRVPPTTLVNMAAKYTRAM